MKTGLAIAKRREEIGMTQEELAKAVGVSKTSISRWESGDISNMRRDRIQRLAEALKVSPLSLLAEETEGLFQDAKNAAPGDDVRSRIIEFIVNSTDSQADRIQGFLEGAFSESFPSTPKDK